MARRAPKQLSRPTRQWWLAVQDAYELDETASEILTMAGELRDRAEDARQIVAVEGSLVSDRFGQQREHPAAKLERDSKIAFARLMRELGLAADDDDFRPPRIGG